MPSSRTWIRSVCAPDVAKETVVACDSQYAAFCHPQPLRLVAVLSVARLTRSASVDSIGYTLDPLARASENCTQTESLNFELASACRRSHSVYGVPAAALNDTST